MPSEAAAEAAFAASREPIATTSASAAVRMPGITFFTPMSAVDRIPQRTRRAPPSDDAPSTRSIPRTLRAMRDSDLTRVRAWTSLAHVCKRGSQTLRVDRVDAGQRSETVRRSNLGAIVRGLHEHGPLSRSELVADTGLTRSAIRSHVGELVASGFVTEAPAIRLGTPGRPSPLVKLEPASAAVLSLEIL